ncbi:MAG: glycosyltransferase [Gemmatimonadota bacterium]|nr:glycosyltransferase [Gemmatimonadota bacterium]
MSAVSSELANGQKATSAATTLRVTFLLGGLDVGGAEMQAIAMAGEMQRLGHSVELIALADGPLRALAYKHHLVLHVLPRVAGLALAAVPQLTRLVSSSRTQVLYAFLEVQWLLALATASRLPAVARPRVVLGLRSSNYDARPTGLKARAVRTLTRFCTHTADLLIANSRAGLDSYRTIVSSAPAGLVVPNGVEVERFAPSSTARVRWRRDWSIPLDATIVGHVGRLDPVKDHELLLRAFALACADDESCHLVCVGHGEPSRALALGQLAESLGIANRVHLVGGYLETSTLYPAFDVLALTSRREGFPNVVAEAMSCGVPAVVTDTGASADIVAGFGEVVPVGAIGAFADGLSRLLSRRSVTLSQDSRSHIATHFSLNTAASRTATALRSLFLVNTE